MMNLTIVYSTRQKNEKFFHHLQQSCGLESPEILEFTNSGDQSLSKIYNQGIKLSQQTILVFVHDDVIFENHHWGITLIEHFQKGNFGILGVAGTTELPESGIWWENSLNNVGVVKHQHQDHCWTSHYCGYFGKKIIPVSCVDGVFIAVNLAHLKETFNEEISGFHFYDIDFCVRNYLAGVNIGVIFDIPMIHHSVGQLDSAWEKNRQQFLATHRYHLPCVCQGEIIVEEEATSQSLHDCPKVSVIILNKSKNLLLFNTLLSFAEKSIYPSYEIIIADTGSSFSELKEIKHLITHSKLNIRLITFDTYHFAQINNLLAFQHTDEHSELLLFCNNDVEFMNDVLSKMVEVYLQHKDHCGTVGCRLYFADQTLQHAGIMMEKKEDQLNIGHKGFRSHYHFSPHGVESVVGSTAACLLIARTLFKEIGGFNEGYLECLEDVELNLMCLKQGKINFLANEAVAYHFESQTRQRKGIIQEDYEKLKDFLRNNPLINLDITQ